MAWSTDNCTVGRTMAILGERWTVVVLREVFNGVRRFDDIRRHSGIPRQVLSNRLASLVEQDILRAGLARSDWLSAIDEMPIEEIRADPELMSRIAGTAPALFGDNCAACHGAAATGGPGFPSLVDAAWLWGGDAETVMETLRVGINAQHPDTRWAQMLAFGRDGILSRGEIRSVAGYVQSLSGAEVAPEVLETGTTVFADNCASCHGADGRGNTDLGAPNLTDDFWIYGGDAASIYRTIWDGRQGVMPSWEERLSHADRKMLTVYLQELAGEGAP